LTIFRYLYGLTGGPQEDVEDLTAETFERAWKSRRMFQGDESAAIGWVMKIARHLVIDGYRRRKARPITAGEIPDQLPQAGQQPEEFTLSTEEQKTLWTVMAVLPADAREILTLRYMLGWRVNEVAAFLQIPDNTVSVVIRRALERLRREWPADEEK
jgi:RNA polymerase sigma-70 factor (ECF subfamily)